MKFAGYPSAFLVLNSQQPATQRSQRILRVAPCSYTHRGNTNLGDGAPVFTDRKIIHQPMAQIARLAGQLCRYFAIQNRLAALDHLPQHGFRPHANFPKNL